VSKCVIQPIIDSAKSESLSTHLAMGSGTLSGSKAQECFGTGEMFVEFFGLSLEEHVFFCVQDQCRTGNLFSNAVPEMVFERSRLR
jgi:hypothetical protein